MSLWQNTPYFPVSLQPQTSQYCNVPHFNHEQWWQSLGSMNYGQNVQAVDLTDSRPTFTSNNQSFNGTQNTATNWKQPIKASHTVVDDFNRKSFYSLNSENSQNINPNYEVQTVEEAQVDIQQSAKQDQMYKDFLKKVKEKEKEGLAATLEYLKSMLNTIPETFHWKICLELADLAKKENALTVARRLYKIATRLEPTNVSPWLEYAKMEEEFGRMKKCQQILVESLNHFAFNENLMIKAIRIEEKMGNINGARKVLSRLKYIDFHVCWKLLLEGAGLEARAGNVDIARKIYKYLMLHAPTYGNIFQDAAVFEEKFEFYEKAISITGNGTKHSSRYGPLWITLIRCLEKCCKGDLVQTRQAIEKSISHCPSELKWKILFEAAQIEDRMNNLQEARNLYVATVKITPSNLIWRVWMAGARTEMRLSRDITTARRLIQKSVDEAPTKKKAQVMIEWARVEEYSGNVAEARRILFQARKENNVEWKVHLEIILLEMRSGNYENAIKCTEEAIKVHSGTGRLWALLIQLKRSKGEKEQFKVFKTALQEVPKSGEVWCEGAKIHIERQNYEEAKKFLEFAVHFTPQFGDSFIEMVRVEVLNREEPSKRIELLCLNADPNYGVSWGYCKDNSLCSIQQVLRNARSRLLDQNDALLSMDCRKQFDLSSADASTRWRLIFGCDYPKP